MKTAIHAVAVSLLLLPNVLAKRVAPAEVPSINTGEAVVSVPHFAGGERKQNGGFIEGHDPETKELLWRIQVYETVYDKDLETDVQDVFIKSLSFDKVHGILVLSDEKDRIYVVNLKTRKVTLVG